MSSFREIGFSTELLYGLPRFVDGGALERVAKLFLGDGGESPVAVDYLDVFFLLPKKQLSLVPSSTIVYLAQPSI